MKILYVRLHKGEVATGKTWIIGDIQCAEFRRKAFVRLEPALRFNNISGSNYLTFVISLAKLAREVIRQNCGLTLSQYRLLADIEKDEGVAKIADLGARLDLSVSSISTIVSDLEKNSQVTREDGYEDSRVVKVEITPLGRDAIRIGDQAIANAMAEFLSPGQVLVDRVSPEAKSQYIEKLGKGRSLPPYIHLSYSRIESMIICEKALQRICFSHDLTTLEYRILLMLAENDSIGKLSDFARLLLTKPANLATAIKPLKKSGSVVRSRDRVDRRNVVLEMTAAGYETWFKVDNEVSYFFKNHTSEFADEELALSFEVMNICVENLQREYLMT